MNLASLVSFSLLKPPFLFLVCECGLGEGKREAYALHSALSYREKLDQIGTNVGVVS